MKFLALLLCLFSVNAYALTCASTAFDTTTGVTCATTSQRTIVTVSGLPTCNSGTKGAMYLVTDALAPVALATVAGSGAVVVGVTCNGTAWIVQ